MTSTHNRLHLSCQKSPESSLVGGGASSRSLSILARFFFVMARVKAVKCVYVCVLVFSRAFCELVHLDERFLLSIERDRGPPYSTV